MLTHAEMKALLKENLHNDSTFSDPTDLDLFLTLGQQKIVRDHPSGLGLKQGTFDTVADTQEYSLASDFYQIRALWNVTSGWKLEPETPGIWADAVESYATIPTGSPRWYLIRGYDTSSSAWRMRLHYTPDGVYSMKYFYYWMPSAINTANGVGPFPAIGLDELLLWSATLIARERNDSGGQDGGGHATAFSNYQRELKNYKAFSASGPDYISGLRSQIAYDGGPTGKLPPEFPA